MNMFTGYLNNPLISNEGERDFIEEIYNNTRAAVPPHIFSFCALSDAARRKIWAHCNVNRDVAVFRPCALGLL